MLVSIHFLFCPALQNVNHRMVLPALRGGVSPLQLILLVTAKQTHLEAYRLSDSKSSQVNQKINPHTLKSLASETEQDQNCGIRQG